MPGPRILSSAGVSILGVRMLGWILAVAVVSTLLSAALSLYQEHQRDLRDLDASISYVRDSQLPAITEAAWNFDHAQLRSQLQAIVDSPWMTGLRVAYGPRESAVITVGDFDAQSAQVLKIALTRAMGTRLVEVGHLMVLPNHAETGVRTRARLALILGVEAFRMLAISCVLLWLVVSLVARHLRTMADFSRNFDPDRAFQPLCLRRATPVRDDELSELCDSLNDAYRRLAIAHRADRDRQTELEAEVAARTEALERLAHHDALTGLPNRLLLTDRLKIALAQVSRREAGLVIAYLDLDGFKGINDEFGHEAGDRVLVELAARLQAVLRDGDTLARVGGDEFVAILPDLDVAGCGPVVERLLSRAAWPVGFDGWTRTLSASLGVAACPRDGTSVDTLLRCADRRMYLAKQGGKNRVCMEDV